MRPSARAYTNQRIGKHRDARIRGRSGLWMHAHGKTIVGQSIDDRQRCGPAAPGASTRIVRCVGQIIGRSPFIIGTYRGTLMGTFGCSSQELRRPSSKTRFEG
jgi:hypothetical protein